jgi:hypothetical protein
MKTKTPIEYCIEAGVPEPGTLPCMGFVLDARALVERVQSDKDAEFAQIKSAYSRALDFVAEQHYAALPAKPTDDPQFVSPSGNCCATDILIAKVLELKAANERLRECCDNLATLVYVNSDCPLNPNECNCRDCEALNAYNSLPHRQPTKQVEG